MGANLGTATTQRTLTHSLTHAVAHSVTQWGLVGSSRADITHSFTASRTVELLVSELAVAAHSPTHSLTHSLTVSCLLHSFIQRHCQSLSAAVSHCQSLLFTAIHCQSLSVALSEVWTNSAGKWEPAKIRTQKSWRATLTRPRIPVQRKLPPNDSVLRS